MATSFSRLPTVFTSAVQRQVCDDFFGDRPLIAYEGVLTEAGLEFTFISANIQQRLGYSADVLLAEDFEFIQHIHPADRRAIASVHSQLTATKTQSLRYRIQDASGQYLWLQDDRKLIKKNGQQIILGSWLDITEQENLRATQSLSQTEKNCQGSKLNVEINSIFNKTETERALNESLERFRKLASNIPGVIYRFQQRVTGEFSLLYCNDYVERVFEVPREVAIADVNSILAYAHPDDLDGFFVSIAESRRTLNKWQYEWRVCLPSGRTRWLKGISEPQRQVNGDTIWDGIIFDSSDRKRVEQQLRHHRHLQDIVIHALQNLLKSSHPDFATILQYLGTAFGTSYAFLLGYQAQRNDFKVIHEWRSEVTSHTISPSFQHIEVSPQSWWMQQVLQNKDILVADPEQLPPDAYALEHRLKFAQLQTLLAIPILDTTQTPWGIICLANHDPQSPPFTKREAQALRLIGEMLYGCVERQMQQAQLAASETKFRDIFDHVGVGLATLDHTFCFTQVNQTFAVMMGADAADFVGESYWQICPATEIKGDRHMVQTLKKTGHAQRETRIYQDFGRQIWVRVNISSVQPTLLEAPYYIAVFEDISERKQAAAMHEALIVRDQLLIQALGDVTYDHCLRRDIFTWQGNYERILGYPPEEMSLNSQHWLKRVHPEDRVKVEAEWERAFHDNKIFELEYRFRHREGHYLWIYNRGILSGEHEGHGKRFVGVCRDISERKRQEQQQRAQNRLYQEIVETANEGIWVMDTATKTTYVNPQIAMMLGYKAAEMVGRSLFEFIEPSQRQTAQAYFEQRGDDLATELDLCFLHREGREVWTMIATNPLWDEEGIFLGALAMVTDITERRAAEQILRQTNAELARATRLKDEFLANMSHELRTPLNAILGLTEVLGDGIYGEMTQRQRRSLETIERNAQHLLALINDILNLAKIEAGQMSFQPVATSIANVCQGSLVLVRQQACKKNINIRLEIPERSPIVYLDQLRIRQALINLLGNAIKFTPVGGDIQLRLTLEPDQQQVSLRVRDNGIGIAAADQQELFQPFVQLDRSLTRRFAGTGLGLALVKKIAELHGGSVSVTSALGVGSDFAIHLPWSPPPEANLATIINPDISSPSIDGLEQKAIAPAATQTLVLIADDDDDNIETLWDYLSGRGYHLIRAKNGREAVTLATTEQPDLILMDIQMPELNGLEAIAQLRAQPQTIKIPIIALTALAMDRDRQKCLDAGANLYLPKPFRLKNLTRHMKTLLNIKRSPLR